MKPEGQELQSDPIISKDLGPKAGCGPPIGTKYIGPQCC